MLLYTINVLIKKTEKELKRQIAKAEKESRAFKSLDQEHLGFMTALVVRSAQAGTACL